MLMRHSIYNVIVDILTDGRQLVFNTATSAYGIMDSDCIALFNDIDKYETFDSLAEKDKSNLEAMKKMGFVVESDEKEFSKIILQENIARFGQGYLHLTIAPTMDCNMACPYCYEERKKDSMSDEVKDKIIEFAEEQITNRRLRALGVTWYGGEPLLELDVIVDLSKRMIELCEANEVKYSAGIITNGALLDRSTAELLKNTCKVANMQITIDGLKDVHDKRRIFRDGTGSFDLIIKNINDAKEYLDIRVRVNVDKQNLESIDSLINFFIYEKKWYDNPVFYLAPVDILTESCNTDGSICLMGKDFAALNSKCLRTIYEKGSKKVADQHYPRRTVSSCAANGLNSYVIDPEGFMYTCYINIGRTEKNVGNIKSFDNTFNKERLRWLTLDTPAQCKECTNYPMCHGGCAHNRVENNNTPKCDHRKFSFKDNLKISYDYYISKKAEESVKAE